MRRLFPIVIILLGCLTLGQGIRSQGYRYDNFVLKPLAAGGVQPVSGALITVCSWAGNGTPCTPKVSNIYSDEALTATITGTGGAGTTNSDANGNFGFYIAPGSYVVTVTGTGFNSYTLKATVPAGGPSSFTIANSPTGAVYSSTLNTITTTAVCNFVSGEAIKISGVGVAGYNGSWVVASPCNGGSSFTYYNYSNPGLAASGGGTVVGSTVFNSGITVNGPVSIPFTGPNPWIDITSSTYGAKCDGATDDTTAIQNALNEANTTVNQRGGTILIPNNTAGACIVASALNMDGMVNITVLGNGFAWGTEGGNNAQASIRFTGTCSAAACLSIRSALDIAFWGVQLSFPNATLASGAKGMIDLSWSPLNTDSGRLSFHYSTFMGPGQTIGPIVFDQNTDTVLFDSDLFTGASVFVAGPVNNAAGFSDKTIFRACNFLRPGTSAIQNASVDWSFWDNIFIGQTGGTTAVPALQYTGAYTNMQNLVMIGNEFLSSGAAPANAITLISIPAVSGNLGGLTFVGNLVAPTDTNITVMNLGNNQIAVVSNNTFSQVAGIIALGTGVGLQVGPNIYSSTGNVLSSGTPATGQVTDTTGVTTFYGTAGFNFNSTVQPTAAGIGNSGSGGQPWLALFLGTAATNNFKFQPATTTGARIVNLWDFGANGPTTQNYPGITILTSQYTNSTTGFTNVAGGNTIQFPVLANTTYTAECHLYYQAAATGGLNIEFTGPAAPTTVIYGLDDPSAAATFNSAVATAYGTSLGQAAATNGVNFDAIVSFSLINGVNAGTVNLLGKSSAAAQLQIQAGSFCRIQ